MTDKAQELAGQAQDQAGEAGEAVEDAKDTAEGAAEDAQEQGQEIADGVETYLPEMSALKGLEVTENGDIPDKDGNIIGRITEGDSADLVGMTLNEEGEILDEVSGFRTA